MRLSVKKAKTYCFLAATGLPPKGITENLTACLTSIFQEVQNEKKERFGDFNLNCFNYNEDSSIKHFYHKVFEFGLIPLIDKPTRVCKNSMTMIDNIFINCVFDNTLKKVIIQVVFKITYQLLIIFTIQTGKN